MSDCAGCDRRGFLKLAGLGLMVSALDPSFLRAAADPRLERMRGLRATGKTLVYVSLRGGCDGLNLTIPTESGEYALYRGYRPTIAIDRSHPDFRQLTPDFGFHPLVEGWTSRPVARR